ncbi:IS21 family transposase [Clostridium sp. 19966]|uniref:IS21 family transposase n=1 Tax=Clostridium sp. 19966 TaxID=2768166 RepID=UPI0028E042E3|nr:IS21 family transposase [Clostridium sp. 19966]MDT8719666.1 IS21 family transposase [Clostridium sp. 19966]
MKKLQDWYTVKELHRNGVSIKKIARDLRMSKNTVKKLIALEEEPKYRRIQSPTKIDEYKDLIRIWYLDKEFDFNGTRIYRELCKKGYEGGINPIYRFLSLLDCEKTVINRKATVRFETPPGDQAQFDWSEYEMWINEEKITVYCFSMILPYSRRKAMIFSTRMNAVSVYEAIQDLFIELGGVTREIVIDNPKALVISHASGSEVNFNEDALRLFAHLKTTPNACKPLRARTKGKIEKPFQFIEEQFIKGNKFNSMEELNDAAKAFMKETNLRIHGTTGRIPEEMFLEEKDQLIGIKSKKVLELDIEERIVSNDSYVMVDTNRYSVPVAYVGTTVKIRVVYGFILEIFDARMNHIKTYRTLGGKKGKVTDNSDYKDIASLVPKSIPEIRRVFEKTFRNGADFYELASRLTNQAHFHAREILKLRDLYDVEELEIILQHCIENNIVRADNIKAVIKERFLKLILEHEIIGLKEREKRAERHKLPEGLVRSLAYYTEGGQN